MASNTTHANYLIHALPTGQRNDVLKRCVPVKLEYGEILAETHERIRHVYFPLDAYISRLTVFTGSTLEVGLIGNEGMLGTSVMLGVAETSLRARVQGTGTALRMSTRNFRQALDANPALRKLIGAYQHVLIEQLAQNAACSLFHSVSERLARWLLMTQDRAHAPHFHLTQELMSRMLGVRRSAVSIAASNLKDQGLITYIRGDITINDRKSLKAAACECYGLANDTYTRTLG